MNEVEKNKISKALSITNQLIPLVNQAENQFKSARNWGFLDILGGGFLIDLIKHSKLNSVANLMNQINFLLNELQDELKEIQFSTDYSMNTMTLATFADFLFDGILSDVYMQSKIMKSLDQVQELKRRLEVIRLKLSELLGN